MNDLSHTDFLTRIRSLARRTNRERVSMEGYHSAAVLVPVILEAASPALLFTKRTELVETHKGQVSFPGGTMEPGDSSVEHTALREAQEEIGIRPEDVEVTGLLDDLATPTGFIITPVVGIIAHLGPLSPNEDEVAEVFRVPLSFFANPSNARSALRSTRGEQREVWYYQYDTHSIWGATAMIVRSLLRSIGNSMDGIRE